MDSRQAKSADIDEATMVYSCGKCREELSRQRDSTWQQIVCGLCSRSIRPLFADGQVDCSHQNLKLPEVPTGHHHWSFTLYPSMGGCIDTWKTTNTTGPCNGELLKAARKKRKKAKCQFTIATILALSPQQALFSFIQEHNELPSTLVFLQKAGRDGVSVSSNHSADVDLENITD